MRKEEAIKILNEDIKGHYISQKQNGIHEKYEQSIETVLNYIKELEETLKYTQNSWYSDTKKIKELEEENKEYKEYIKRLDKLNARDFIFKQVIRDKIEELRKEKLKYDNEIRIYTMRESFVFQEMILKELLEEE